MKKLTIYANDEIIYEHDKDMFLEESQLAFLDKMDNDMSRGLKIRGELITDPDARQRALFVAMNLIKALQQENEAIVIASCSYLVNKMPSLVEIRADNKNGGLNIDLIEAH